MEFEIVRKDIVIELQVTERELRILTSAVGHLSMDAAKRSPTTKGYNIEMNDDLVPLHEALKAAVRMVE